MAPRASADAATLIERRSSFGLRRVRASRSRARRRRGGCRVEGHRRATAATGWARDATRRRSARRCKHHRCQKYFTEGELRLGKVPPKARPTKQRRVHWRGARAVSTTRGSVAAAAAPAAFRRGAGGRGRGSSATRRPEGDAFFARVRVGPRRRDVRWSQVPPLVPLHGLRPLLVQVQDPRAHVGDRTVSAASKNLRGDARSGRISPRRRAGAPSRRGSAYLAGTTSSRRRTKRASRRSSTTGA